MGTYLLDFIWYDRGSAAPLEIYEFWKILFVQKVSSPEINAKVEEFESISKTKKNTSF